MSDPDADKALLPDPFAALPVSGPPVSKTSARMSALVEVVICSGLPSQLALSYLIALAGYSPLQGGQLSFEYVAILLLLDAAVMVALIFWILYLHGERPREVFLGSRPVGREVLLGVPLTLVVFGLAVVLLTAIQGLAPSLHNVPQNPLEHLITSGRQALLFAGVATIGGGLREEIQRAFILYRFEQHLGGAGLGLIVYSVVFGAGHSLQGWDAAITTAALGLFWGVIYLSRRSIVACVVSHSGFNTAEIVRFLLITAP